jgi:hypothetical protein
MSYGKAEMTGMVEARVRFLDACEGKPVFHGRQRELDNLPLVERTIGIANVRDQARAYSLDAAGFALVSHRSNVNDFLDSNERRTIYGAELEDLIVSLTGASSALCLGSSVVRRSERSAGFAGAGTTVLGRFAHCDYSPNAAGSRRWLDRVLAPEEAGRHAQRRYCIYNVWRPLSDPPQDAPLALCELGSLSEGDRVFADSVNDPEDGPEVRFELSLYRHNPKQRWVYFSDMTRDEVLVFKGFDPEAPWAGGVPHAAFDDPSCPPHAPARESIDERVIAFFEA